MGKRVEVICEFCGKKFEKSVSQFNRSLRVGRRHLCSRSCAGKLHNKEQPSDASHIRGMKRQPTEDSPYRWFLKTIRQRSDKHGESDITIDYIKELWQKQGGRCPLTGWALDIPISSGKWGDGKMSRRASLDRIDSSKPYVQGNVRFISFMANIAKNTLTDDELIEFCKAVASNVM